jgi:hypothetical protein
MARYLVLRLQTVILLVVLPAIACVVLATGQSLYADLDRVIMTGFERKLRAAGSGTGAFLDGDTLTRMAERQRLGPLVGVGEDHPDYVAPVRRMQAIKQALGLTYLYTQVLEDREDAHATYVHDTTTGAEHTSLGAREELPPASFVGARRVLGGGEMFVSGIQAWERWGQIKTAFAPIYGADGRVQAMVGAEVDVAQIERKTRLALSAVALVGLLTAIAAGYVAFYLSSALTRPIGKLNELALGIAAGHFNQHAKPRVPADLMPLQRQLEGIGETLVSHLAELDEATQALEQRRRGQELNKALAHLGESPVASVRAALDIGWRSGLPYDPDASGWVSAGGRTLAWICKPRVDDDAFSLRNDLALTAERLLTRYSADGAGLIERLAPLFKEQVDAFVWLDPAAGILRATCRQATRLDLVTEHGIIVVLDLVETRAVRLNPGEVAMLASRESQRVGDVLEELQGMFSLLGSTAEQVTAAVSGGLDGEPNGFMLVLCRPEDG